MKTVNFLFESQIRANPIYESAYKGARLIIEADLSADQVKQIFTSIETSAKSTGSANRTMLGKGADAASAVNQAFQQVKTKISQSGPVTGFDAAVDKIQAGLLQAAGGESGKVAQAIDSYREFAKAHPIMQGAVYAGLIALAGISGAGLGGAALLGGIKVFDRLLQGDKASSALWKGFKTGAVAYGASKLGDVVRGQDTQTTTTSTQYTSQQQGYIDSIPLKGEVHPSWLKQFPTDKFQYQNDGDEGWQIINKLTGNKVASFTSGSPTVDTIMPGVADNFESVELNESLVLNRYIDESATMRFWALNESLGRSRGGVQLTEEAVNLILDGLWSNVKSAAGAVAGAVGGAVKTGWQDATNKVTANKLDLNWRRGAGKNVADGGTVDSEVLRNFLKSQGIADDLIDDTYKKMGIPAQPAQNTQQQPAQNTQAQAQQPEKPQSTIFSDPQALAASFEKYMQGGGTIPPQLRGVVKDILKTALRTVENKNAA